MHQPTLPEIPPLDLPELAGQLATAYEAEEAAENDVAAARGVLKRAQADRRRLTRLVTAAHRESEGALARTSSSFQAQVRADLERMLDGTSDAVPETPPDDPDEPTP